MKVSMISRLKILVFYIGFWVTVYFISITTLASWVLVRPHWLFKSTLSIYIIYISLISTIMLFLFWVVKIYKLKMASPMLCFLFFMGIFFLFCLVGSRSARSNILFWLSEETLFPKRKFEVIPLFILLKAIVFSLLPSGILTEYNDINTFYKPIDHELKNNTNNNSIPEIDTAITSLSSDESKYRLLKDLWPFHSLSFDSWHGTIIERKKKVWQSLLQRIFGKTSIIHNKIIRRIILFFILYCYILFILPFAFFIF